MFWVLLLCHFVADYPLQTDGMVLAKKRLPGLAMHVFIHFVTMVAVLCGVIKLQPGPCLVLALSVSGFHLAIDHWKNVLSRLRPSWVIFSYVQDQILHVLSILFVGLLWSKYSGTGPFDMENPSLVYAMGFILSTHFWFVTERVFSYKRPDYQQWVGASMWPRMMSRGMFFGLLLAGFSLSGVVLLAGSIVVGWNDLEADKRTTVLTRDLGGVILLMGLTWLILL